MQQLAALQTPIGMHRFPKAYSPAGRCSVIVNLLWQAGSLIDKTIIDMLWVLSAAFQISHNQAWQHRLCVMVSGCTYHCCWQNDGSKAFYFRTHACSAACIWNQHMTLFAVRIWCPIWCARFAIFTYSQRFLNMWTLLLNLASLISVVWVELLAW